MVRVKLVTKYPISYCIDREKVEVTADGRSGFVNLTAKADSDKFVIESDYVNVESEVAFGKKISRYGLVLEFPIFEGSGATLYDTSGNNNNGTIYGAVWHKLPTGKWILRFDGKDDYVLVPLQYSTNLTVIAWVLAKAYNYFAPGIIQVYKSDKPIEDPNNKIVGLWVRSDSRKLSGRVIQSDLSVIGFPETEVIEIDKWYMVGLIAGKDKAKLCVNGEVVYELDYSGVLADFDAILIGRQGGDFWQGYKGLVRVYSHELSENKLQKLYEIEKTLFEISP